jgi:DNA-binding PadR family transcriptional regulator
MPPSDPHAATPLKPVEFLVLVVLADQPLHGYGIVQEIDARTGGRVRLRPGDVYRVIYRLGERGLLQESGRRAAADDDERRTYYRITPEGRRVATAEAEMLTDVAAPLVSRAAGGEAAR